MGHGVAKLLSPRPGPQEVKPKLHNAIFVLAFMGPGIAKSLCPRPGPQQVRPKLQSEPLVPLLPPTPNPISLNPQPLPFIAYPVSPIPHPVSPISYPLLFPIPYHPIVPGAEGGAQGKQIVASGPCRGYS